MTYALSTTLHTSFEDAVELTRKALADQGFGVLTEIDMKATLKAKLGEDMEDYLIPTGVLKKEQTDGSYDGSPAIVADGTEPPPETMNTYRPSACPGGRPPHLWLAEGRSLYDCFGFDWTLLRLAAHGEEPEKLKSIDLNIVDLKSEQARDLYGADAVLIRPDQIVAWRGNDARVLEQIFARLMGHG